MADFIHSGTFVQHADMVAGEVPGLQNKNAFCENLGICIFSKICKGCFVLEDS